MAATAMALGHEYMVQTDHSARLTIAHGLDRQRLTEQLDQIAAINADIAAAGHDFRILSGMEVDILEDGALDLADDMLERLDVVVASVHSKLRMETRADDRADAARRRLAARRHPRALHRPDDRQAPAERVRRRLRVRRVRPVQHGGRDQLPAGAPRPARELLDVAIEYGCWFSIDSDAHATGQLEWQPHGCDRAAEREVPIERIINTMSADDLLAWTAG